MTQTFRNPKPTVDIVIRLNGGVVLIKRRNPPLGWALPGGYQDEGESCEAAARREADRSGDGGGEHEPFGT